MQKMRDNYVPYNQTLLEHWDRGEYVEVIEQIRHDPMRVCVFCVDLAHTEDAVNNLIRLAAEFAKRDQLEINPKQVVENVNRLQRTWRDGMRAKDDAVTDAVALELMRGSNSQIVTFCSTLLFSDNRAEGIFYCGYLGGTFSKLKGKMIKI